MRSEQYACVGTQSKCKHMLAFKTIVDKSCYNGQIVIKVDTFCIYHAIYEELSSKKNERTFEMVNDDVEFYKNVEDLKKLLQNFNIGA